MFMITLFENAEQHFSNRFPSRAGRLPTETLDFAVAVPSLEFLTCRPTPQMSVVSTATH